MPIIYSSKPLEKRKEHDFYPTPANFIRTVFSNIEWLLPKNHLRVLDPGCGTGVWGEVLKEFRPDSYLVGVDIREDHKCSNIYDRVITQDFLSYEDEPFDLVIGNPPFSLAEQFVTKSLDLTKTGGRAIFLLRLTFLESAKRYKSLYNNIYRPYAVCVSPSRISFTADGKTNEVAYGIYIWEKDYKPDVSYLDWLPPIEKGGV